ncbi:NAD-dependent succinate-semialdehyde dehydrogenase [Paraglaciecola psychrophila]|uniref:Succinate-semialdehyde dehydrogenase n=1 Tax=Paraglaciecola psychrophila 170 TaxID=1129794 RepID=K7A4A6_9ALTE|nr:NAD-dependent succinate-semialdehyde dehydrogenase [Paraglaciecola psychrophila]AGH46163.1 succinate-semialdehyde dehydrogenase [Paraglaciecola psychrophila 170]GAC35703.1 succinate-semialdehyde dehydrogenase [Paraglaciecola psychrophila 170]
MNLQDLSIFKNQCLINGQWSSHSELIDVRNPADGKILTQVPYMDGIETRLAINAANHALSSWKSLTAYKRAEILMKWHDLVVARANDLATIMTLEQGKPLNEAKGEVLYAASYIKWFAEEARRAYGEIIPSEDNTKKIHVTKEPIGVCAAITPWNFPAAMITRKVAPALAAGCTIVVKPAMETPLTAFALLGLAQDAGVPDGVINVLTGDAKKIGAEMTSNPIVRKLSFTGSTSVGAKLMADCAPSIKKLSLELGGNAPFIVFDDANLELAASELIKSKFRNAGQTCVCANRIYIQKGVYKQFSEVFLEKVKQLKVGNGLEAGTNIGPLIDQKAVRKVRQHIEDALCKGASILIGGEPHSNSDNWFPPTVLLNANQTMQCANEETFGPLAPLICFDTIDAAIQMANSTEFGLAAYMFSENHRTIEKVSSRLEVGMVGVNTGIISTAVAPFGGVKSSGIGREGARAGLDEYLEIKYVCYGMGLS